MENYAQRLQDYLKFFEALTPGDLDRLCVHFDPEARFKDPFNDVHGIDEIRRVFKHMFEVCIEPRFEILDWALQENVAYVKWQFTFSLKQYKSGINMIEGVSRIKFSLQGLVTEHIDYWDPAEYIYQKLPMIGGLFRWLKLKLAA